MKFVYRHPLKTCSAVNASTCKRTSGGKPATPTQTRYIMTRLVANMWKDVKVTADNTGWRRLLPWLFCPAPVQRHTLRTIPDPSLLHNLPPTDTIPCRRTALPAASTAPSFKTNGFRCSFGLRTLAYAFVGQEFSGWPDRTPVLFSSPYGGKNL